MLTPALYLLLVCSFYDNSDFPAFDMKTKYQKTIPASSNDAGSRQNINYISHILSK